MLDREKIIQEKEEFVKFLKKKMLANFSEKFDQNDSGSK